MKRFTGIVVLTVLIALVVATLVWAAAGDSLLKFRYDIDSTVAELNYSQDLSSNIQDQLDAISGGAATTLADTKIFVGQSTGLSAAKTFSLTGDVVVSGLANSGAGAATLEAGTDGQMFIYNAGDGWAPDTISGDASVSNTGDWTNSNVTRTISNKITNYAITSSDCGKVFSNAGAGANPVIFNTPAASTAGCEITLVHVDAGIINGEPNGSDQIIGETDTGGDYIQSSVGGIGNSITIVSDGTTKWFPTALWGTFGQE